MARSIKAYLPLSAVACVLVLSQSAFAANSDQEASLAHIEGVNEILADNTLAFPSAEEQLQQIQAELANEDQGSASIYCDDTQVQDEFSTCLERDK
ncbi:hypothetical protein [Shewanella waksmanii]|uniref:hypothetical protein n=1 Tax=Shewanella waksmanii TaxID=213783 RepID=UPI00049121D1|nr:hypothetical protein [Shewanella waksmanii]